MKSVSAIAVQSPVVTRLPVLVHNNVCLLSAKTISVVKTVVNPVVRHNSVVLRMANALSPAPVSPVLMVNVVSMGPVLVIPATKSIAKAVRSVLQGSVKRTIVSEASVVNTVVSAPRTKTSV